MSWSPFLIDPGELAFMLGRSGLSIIDASWYLPAQNRDARGEYEAGHVPGAVFFDQDAVVDPASDLPHAFPPAEVFAEAAGRLGISETDTIVVYDGIGHFSAPRAWWLFRTFGARDVRVLDGGFPAWKAAGHPVETDASRIEPTVFQAKLDPDALASMDDMRHYVSGGGMQIADARPLDRFSGAVPEPRAGVRSGHMPGAASLPFLALSQGGRLKQPMALKAAFAEAGIDPNRPVVTTCGSGVTAAVINLALASLGTGGHKLYDGSWTEWGSASDTPVEGASP